MCRTTRAGARCSDWLVAQSAPARRSAFTLVELVVVIAIVTLLLGLAIPGITSMWRQRGEASSINLIRGLLESARTQAIRNSEESGLFFYLDDQGIQRVVFIAADPPSETGDDARMCTLEGYDQPCINEPMAVNRFRVKSGKVQTLSPPYRAAASWAIASDLDGTALYPFALDASRPILEDGRRTPRYHRNYFAILFSRAGQMIVGRDVLIHDVDSAPDGDGDGRGDDGRGDRTGLIVEDVVDYWTAGSTGQNNGVRMDVPQDLQTSNDTLFDIVVLDDLLAANFRSIDGLVVYDDSFVNDLPPGSGDVIHRTLIERGQALFVTRYTGDVIFGARGE